MSKYLCADCVCKEQCNGEWTTHCARYVPKEHKLTNEEWMRSATFEELAGAIYEWHTKVYARGRLEVDLNPITEVVEWLKEKHNEM